MNKYEYIKDISTGIEVVSMENVATSYPSHTHIGHYVFGIVTDGIWIVCLRNRLGSLRKNISSPQFYPRRNKIIMI